MTRFALTLLLALLAGSLAAHPSGDGHWHVAKNGAAPAEGSSGAGGGSATPRGGITLDEAVAQVRSETGGRVLSAKTVKRGGSKVHRIKVLTPQNQVQVHEIEAGNAR